MIRLSLFLKYKGISVVSSVIENPKTSINNDFEYMGLHHSNSMTPYIVALLPEHSKFWFGNNRGGADVQSDNMLIEVGDTRVENIEEYLKSKSIKVLVVHWDYTTHPILNIFEFSRGENWSFVEEWAKHEETEILKYMRVNHEKLSQYERAS